MFPLKMNRTKTLGLRLHRKFLSHFIDFPSPANPCDSRDAHVMITLVRKWIFVESSFFSCNLARVKPSCANLLISFLIISDSENLSGGWMRWNWVKFREGEFEWSINSDFQDFDTAKKGWKCRQRDIYVRETYFCDWSWKQRYASGDKPRYEGGSRASVPAGKRW